MVTLKHDYGIRSTKTAFILIKDTKKVNKEGEPVFISKGSYSKFSQALEGYCSEVMREYVKEYDMNLSEVKKVLESLKEEIKAFDVSDVLLSKSQNEKAEIIEDCSSQDE